MKWFNLSFASEETGKNLGTCMLQAEDFIGAIGKAHRLGINPGGQIMSQEADVADDEEIRPELVDKLFTREESIAMQKEPREFFIRKKPMREPLEWLDSTEEDYYDMLGCVPPAAQSSLGFLVGEAYDHRSPSGDPRYMAYICRGADLKYLKSSRPMTEAEFRSLSF